MSDLNKKDQRPNTPNASNPSQNKGAPQQGNNRGTQQPGANTNKPNMGGAGAGNIDRNKK